MPRRPRRRSRCPGSGRWVNRWWCPSRSVCTEPGGECRTAPLRTAPPPPARSSWPEGHRWISSSFNDITCIILLEVGSHVSELPVVWIILEFKEAFREKLDSSQSFRRSFLKRRRYIFFVSASFIARAIMCLLYLNCTGDIDGCTLARQVTKNLKIRWNIM